MKNNNNIKNFNYVVIFKIQNSCINCIPDWIRAKKPINIKVSNDNRVAIIGNFDEDMLKDYEYYKFDKNWINMCGWMDRGLCD